MSVFAVSKMDIECTIMVVYGYTKRLHVEAYHIMSPAPLQTMAASKPLPGSLCHTTPPHFASKASGSNSELATARAPQAHPGLESTIVHCA